MLALEREEHAFGRLVRGLVSRTGAAGGEDRPGRRCARWALAAVMLRGARGVPRTSTGAGRPPGCSRWRSRRSPSRRSGVAIGGLAREVRAASLLAFMLALPIASLALVPSGAVSAALYDAIRIVSGAFPFKPALRCARRRAQRRRPRSALPARAPRRADRSASPCSRGSRCGGST